MKRTPQHDPVRRGSTLSEVMIAVLVISIGVVSVGSLFPMSVVRAIQANKVTQSTIHRFNAETMVRSLGLNDYSMFFGIDNRPGVANVDDDLDNLNFPDRVDSQPDGIADWNPGPDGLPGVAGVDDDGDTVVDNLTESGWAGSDDYPIWDLKEVLWPGSDDTRIVVIDPLGYYLMQANSAAWANYFGGPPSSTNFPLIRRSGGHWGNNYNTTINHNFTQAQASRLVTLPDQWSTLLEVPLTTAPYASGGAGKLDTLMLPTTLDAGILNAVGQEIANGGQARAVFFGVETKATDPNNRFVTYTRDVLNEDWNGNGTIDGSEVDLDLDGMADATTGRKLSWYTNKPLPATFQAERVMIQKLSYDFTWMVTARLPTAPPTRPQMDVVVFFKRKFQITDERIFGAPGSNPPVTNQVRTFNPPAPIKDPYTMTVGFTGTPPVIQKGSFVFDVSNGYWYRITEMKLTTSTMVVFTVDRVVYDANGDGYIRVAFPQNIVDVYPIGE